MATNRAYPRKKRTNKNGSAADAAAIVSYQNNQYAGGQKNMAIGPEFLKQNTDAFVSGRDVSGAGEAVMPGSILYVYNNSAGVAWIALSTEALGAAPSGFTSGIPLKSQEWTILSAGENSFVRSSANTVGLYEVKDDTAISNANE